MINKISYVHWKRVSEKKLSARKRHIFVDKKPLSPVAVDSVIEGHSLKSESGFRILPCAFFDDVLCVFREDAKFDIMPMCFECSHYKRFMREMEEEDNRIMDEIDEIRRTGVYK
jgi:hypothetical protein